MAFQFVDITKTIECVMTKNVVFQKLLLGYYYPIVKREVRLSKSAHTDSILCIGGGYFPCTAILFHQLTGATVTVIDNDMEAINVSRQLIKRMGLENKVIIQAVDGTDVCPKNHDLIHVAMQISPKQEIVQKMYKEMIQESKILVRVPKECLEVGYQKYVDSFQNNDHIQQPFFSNIERTLLYVR